MESSERGRLAGERAGSRLGRAEAMFKYFLHFESDLHLRKSLWLDGKGPEGQQSNLSGGCGTRLQAVMACTRMGQREGGELLWGS